MEKKGLHFSKTLSFQWNVDFYRKLPLKDNVETSHLFTDQYNTEAGNRIWEANEAIYQNDDIKEGYYISSGIEEIRKAQAHKTSCGYCGKQYTDLSIEYCTACIHSEYLKLDFLPLLYLVPIIVSSNKTRKLRESKSEKTVFDLKEAYNTAQIKGNKNRTELRREKEKDDFTSTHEKKLKSANDEYEGKVWLWENDISLDNVIYYDHTDTFCFGWRNGLDTEVAELFKVTLKDFPFKYELKTGDQR